MIVFLGQRLEQGLTAVFLSEGQRGYEWHGERESARIESVRDEEDTERVTGGNLLVSYSNTGIHVYLTNVPS